MTPIKATKENNRAELDAEPDSRTPDSRKRQSRPVRSLSLSIHYTIIPSANTGSTPDSTHGLNARRARLRRERAIYAQKNEDVFIPRPAQKEKITPPVYLAGRE